MGREIRGQKCPKCKKTKIREVGCCGNRNAWQCYHCGFKAEKKFFVEGILPSQRRKI